ncbi:MAG: polysaccharide deacetylase family protein [Candidatus Caccosoma sp.]|nr:polysaccharide deacetylase family protein [Candidatus Caccosoma sp.]
MKKHLKCIYLLLILTSCQAKNVANIKKAKVYYHYQTIAPYLSITFDDGPNRIQTPKVLKILKKYNIKATFFVIGENVEYQKDVLRQVYKEGHEIGNHFYTHDNINKLTKDQIRENIVSNNELIYKTIGVRPKLVRPPYGIVNDNLKAVCGELNMSIIIWTDNKDSRDWALTKDSEIINNLTKKVKNGDIFLFHDSNKKFTNTLSAIDVIIPALQKKGYKWVSVSTLLKN